jgi:hypothetical protein
LTFCANCCSSDLDWMNLRRITAAFSYLLT